MQVIRLKMDATPATIADEVASPFDWPVVAVDGAEGVPISCDQPFHAPALLRVANGIDIRLTADLGLIDDTDGAVLARLDMRFGCALQMFQAMLNERAREALLTGKCRLKRLDAQEPLYLLHGDDVPDAFVTRVLIDGERGKWQQFLICFNSIASITQYGWMVGCVFDGLSDLGMTATLDMQLDHFFAGDRIQYENFKSNRVTGDIRGTETTNVIAALAQRRPDHPAINKALAFCAEKADADGVIRDHSTVAEHNYTVAWPLAVIGRQRNDAQHIDTALHQLRVRIERLHEPNGDFHLRWYEGKRTYRNWSRGVAWYTVGLARTLRHLHDHPGIDDLITELQRAARDVMQFQRPDGLWHVFLHETDTPVETSGSAGIAAALAIGHQCGWLDEACAEAAARTIHGLTDFIEVDGMMHGMSQSNKSQGGEDLQRSDYRVIGQVTMGLAAQAIAALPASLLPADLRSALA